jgi:hypothetical protein
MWEMERMHFSECVMWVFISWGPHEKGGGIVVKIVCLDSPSISYGR